MRPSNQLITAAEHAALRTYLLAKGFLLAHVDATVGLAPGNQSRLQVEQQLTGWLRTRPKAP